MIYRQCFNRINVMNKKNLIRFDRHRGGDHRDLHIYYHLPSKQRLWKQTTFRSTANKNQWIQVENANNKYPPTPRPIIIICMLTLFSLCVF